MEAETVKQTPQSNSVLSNPSHPGMRAGTILHGDSEFPGNRRYVFFTVIAI